MSLASRASGNFSVVESIALHFSDVQCSIIQYSAVQYNAVQCSAVQCNIERCSAVYNSQQDKSEQCNTALVDQFSTVHTSAVQ